MTAREALQPPGERLGWAIVGLGDFACNQILPAFAACARSKVTALVSGDRAKAQQVARQYGVPEEGVYTYATFDQLRDNPAVDVVSIILPNALHGEYTIRAARAGKHVFCEKPMAPTSAECEAMIAACEGAGRTLGIAYRAHFEAHNVEAHRLLREGAIGDLKLIVADHARILDPTQRHDFSLCVQEGREPAISGAMGLQDVRVIEAIYRAAESGQLVSLA